MVAAAERRTCVRPRRRTELLAQRLLTVREQRCKAEARLEQRQAALTTAQVHTQCRLAELAAAQMNVAELTAAPRPPQRPARRHSALAQAKAKVVTKQRQVECQQRTVAAAQRRVSRQLELVATYNVLQTTEAGIKEGKAVFQMHHLKVRSAPALWLQEQFAAFAANFVRWADRWLDSQCRQWPNDWSIQVTTSVKTQVQVAAHTPAFADWLADGCLLTFTEESPFAGYSIQSGTWTFQLSLPLFKTCNFDPLFPI